MQAASALENLKMESPVKKIDFSSPTTQSNGELKAVPLVGLPELPPIASEILDKKDTADDEEPILKENPNRFVLFPIKFHEVRDLTRPSRVTRRWYKD